MSQKDALEQWAKRVGFGPVVPFDGSSTRVGKNPHVRYSGFYLLSFTNGDHYLGESVNVRGRMGGHDAKWGDEIDGVQLILENFSKPQLRAREKLLIREMNRRIPDTCRNIAHASVTAGVNELSEFVDETEQRAWLANPADFNRADDSALKPMSPAQATKYSTAARRFAELPDSVELVESLRTYLENCVPAPRRTEFQSWSVSSGTYGGRRAFCVSVGKMETFVAGPDGSGFIVVRRSALTEHHSLNTIMQRHPAIVTKQREYADAGHDQISLYAGCLADLQGLLTDPDVLRAAGRLTLDVMRKHACVYTRYHCPQLVELVFDSMTRANPDAPLAFVEFDDPDAEPTRPKPLPLTESQAPEDLGTPIEEMTDDVEIYWFVNAGPASTKRNTPADFLDRGEWRMDPRERYESYVQDMLPGERIIVRKRYNTKHAPFDARDNLVSAMDILLTGTITQNDGDGCSVRVAWDPVVPAHTWYLYTNQDPVWAIPLGRTSWGDALIDFAVNDADQDLDYWRNAYFWRDRFGDQ